MIKPWIKYKNTPHVNKALVQLTAFTEDKWSSRVPASKTKLTRSIPDHQWAQPSWHLTSSKRSSLLGFWICWGFFFSFLPSRNLNTSAYWKNCVGDHTSNYEQPYVNPPTAFSHCFHYSRILCQSCSLGGSSFMSNSQTEKPFWFCWRESLLPSPSPESVKLLSLIILPALSQAAESI